MSDKNHEQKNKFIRRKIIIKNLLENRNFRPFYYGNAVVISVDTCPRQGRTAPNAKRFGIVSYTYRFSIYAELIKQEKSATINEGAVKLLKTLLEYAPEELVAAQQAAGRRQEQEREKNRSRGNSNNKFKGK